MRPEVPASSQLLESRDSGVPISVLLEILDSREAKFPRSTVANFAPTRDTDKTKCRPYPCEESPFRNMLGLKRPLWGDSPKRPMLQVSGPQCARAMEQNRKHTRSKSLQNPEAILFNLQGTDILKCPT